MTYLAISRSNSKTQFDIFVPILKVDASQFSRVERFAAICGWPNRNINRR
jgi:hypothetical protein